MNRCHFCDSSTAQTALVFISYPLSLLFGHALIMSKSNRILLFSSKATFIYCVAIHSMIKEFPCSPSPLQTWLEWNDNFTTSDKSSVVCVCPCPSTIQQLCVFTHLLLPPHHRQADICEIIQNMMACMIIVIINCERNTRKEEK